MLGVAAELLECLRLEIGEIGVLAQDRELAARKRLSFTRLILRHAGHYYPISPLSMDRLNARLDQSYPSAVLKDYSRPKGQQQERRA